MTKTNFKLLFLVFLFLGATILFAAAFNPFLRSASLDFLTSPQGVKSLLLLLAVFAVWAVSISLTAYFAPSFNQLAGIFLPAAILFGVVLSGTPSLMVKIILPVVLLVSVFSFALRVRGESADRVKFSVRKIFSPSLKTLTTFMVILFSIAFFFPYRRELQREGFKAPEMLIDRVVDVVGKTLVDTVINQIAESSKLPDKEAVFTEIPEEVWEAGLTETLEEEFGVRIDRVPQSSSDLLSMIRPSIEGKIKSEIENYLEPLTPWLPAIVSLLLFLSLLPLSTVAAYLIAPILAIVFYLLKALGFTSEETKTLQTTRPVLKS